MRSKCIVRGCKSRSYNGSECRFFAISVPQQPPEFWGQRQRMWVEAAGHDPNQFEVKRHHRICSEHFVSGICVFLIAADVVCVTGTCTEISLSASDYKKLCRSVVFGIIFRVFVLWACVVWNDETRVLYMFIILKIIYYKHCTQGTSECKKCFWKW